MLLKFSFASVAFLLAILVAVPGCESGKVANLEPASTEAGSTSGSALASESNSLWLTSYEEALNAAQETGKPILADFTGSDWCGWCIKLKEEVFSKPEFKSWAQENVVLLELDFPRSTKLPAELTEQNEELRKKFEVQGFPTILFLDADGEKIGQYGYDRGGPAAWIAKAEEIMH